MKKPISIILASQSPRRRQLMEQAGLQFSVVVSSVEELNLDSARETVIHNAILKAEDVASIHPDKIVIAADTVVAIEDKVLG